MNIAESRDLARPGRRIPCPCWFADLLVPCFVGSCPHLILPSGDSPIPRHMGDMGWVEEEEGFGVVSSGPFNPTAQCVLRASLGAESHTHMLPCTQAQHLAVQKLIAVTQQILRICQAASTDAKVGDSTTNKTDSPHRVEQPSSELTSLGSKHIHAHTCSQLTACNTYNGIYSYMHTCAAVHTSTHTCAHKPG